MQMIVWRNQNTQLELIISLGSRGSKIRDKILSHDLSRKKEGEKRRKNKFHERKSCVITNDNLYIMQGALPKKYNLVVIFYIDMLNIIISFPFFSHSFKHFHISSLSLLSFRLIASVYFICITKIVNSFGHESHSLIKTSVCGQSGMSRKKQVLCQTFPRAFNIKLPDLAASVSYQK